MPEIDPVILQLRADVAKYNADMQQTARRVDASLKLQEGSIVRLENRMTTGFERVGTASTRAQMLVSSSMNAIRGALAGVSAVALARSFLTISDEAKKLDATLKLATSGFGSFGQAQEDVRRIADETRSGLVETSSLYANFVRGAKELGGTQAEAARATETFSKTLKISGADANQAASATLQFGQALAAGALRGDELNSILEASPRLARLLADAMGRPIGEIKKLGEEGALTSDKLLKALTDTKFTAGIDSEFRQLPVTFDDAMTKVYNAAITTFSAFDKGGQFSSMLASFFGEGADGFSGMEEGAFDTGAEIRATFAGLTDVFRPLIDAATSAFDQISFKALSARDDIGNILRLIDNVDNALIGIDNAARRFDNGVKSTLNEAARRAGNKGRGFSMTPLVKEADRAGTYLKAFDASTQRSRGERAEERFRNAIGGYDVMGNPIAGTPTAPRGTPPRPSAPASGSGKKTSTPKSKLNPEAFAREEASLNDRILSLKAEEVTGITERAKLETDRIEASRAAAQKEIERDERMTAAEKAKIIALSDTVAALQAAKVVTERDKELAEQVAQARAGNLRYEQDVLQELANAADTRQARLEAERRLLASMEAQERAQLEAEIAAGKIADATKARADLATSQTARRGATERGLDGPLAQYQRRFDPDNQKDRVEELVVQELDMVRDGISDALTRRLGIKDPLISGLLDMLIENVIMKPIAEALSKSGGGVLGGLVKGIGSALGISGARAAGGPVQGGKTYLVGEKGPELFRAGASGTIIPNDQLAGAAARGMTGVAAVRPVYNSTIISAPRFDLSGAVITPKLYADMQRISDESAARAGAASYKQSMRDAPSVIQRRQRYGN
ncbi:MAG: tape measure protein [Sphingobium sp.]